MYLKTSICPFHVNINSNLFTQNSEKSGIIYISFLQIYAIEDCWILTSVLPSLSCKRLLIEVD